MNAFMYIRFLSWSIWIWAVVSQTTRNCKCQLRRPVNVLLQQLEGTWYVVAAVNVTNPSQQRSCVRIDYRYNYGQGTVTETRTSIPYNESNYEVNTSVYGMITPGIVDVTTLINNGTVELNFHEYYMQYTQDVSFVVSLCQRFNQQIITDRVALFTRNRIVDLATIQSIYNSIGMQVGNNSNNRLFLVNQTNCSD